MIINREILKGQETLLLATGGPYGSHLQVAVEANWSNYGTDPSPTPGEHEVNFTLDWSDIDGLYNGDLAFFLPSTTEPSTEPWIVRPATFGYGFQTRIVFSTPVHISNGGVLQLNYAFAGEGFANLGMRLRVLVTELPI